MPGVSFAVPGPAGGVGSLACRQRGPTPGRSTGRLGRLARCVRSSLGLPFCHRYYDPLRLPNVHRRFLRYPARPLLPAVSAFCAHKGSTRRSWRAFPAGSFGLAVDSHGCHPALVRAFLDDPVRGRPAGNDEALSSFRVNRVSAWPGLRPRWSLDGLAKTPVEMLRSGTLKPSAFAARRSGPAFGLSSRTTTFKQLSRLNTDPTDLLGPASDLCFLRIDGLCCWAGG